MRKYIVAVLLLAHLTISKASEREVQNDSILREGKTLYKYEKATWLVSDLAYKSSIKNEIRHSLTYAQNDTIVVIYTDKDKQLIYEGMVNKDGKLIKSGMRFKPLTREERHLLAVRKNAIEQINKMNIVKAPSGGQLNIDIIPHNGGYKLYALSGTLQENIVPFGNDYLFYIDYNGRNSTTNTIRSRLTRSRNSQSRQHLAPTTLTSRQRTSARSNSMPTCIRN